MNTDSILIEQKRAELQVKMTILLENLSNIENQLDEKKDSLNLSNLTSLNLLTNEYNSANELNNLKTYEKNSLEKELEKEKKTNESLKIYINNLNNENINNENENNFFNNKVLELKNQNKKLNEILYELKNNKMLLSKEVEFLENENINNKSTKFKNDQLNNNINLQQEYINNEIKNNSDKIKLLQIKIDSLNKELFELENNLKDLKEENENIQKIQILIIKF